MPAPMMHTLVVRPSGQPKIVVTTALVASDIARVAAAIMKLPNAPKLHHEVVDLAGRKLANSDIVAHALVKGARFIHRDSKQPLADHYAIVRSVKRYSTDAGRFVKLAVTGEHDAHELFEITLSALALVELFDIAPRD